MTRKYNKTSYLSKVKEYADTLTKFGLQPSFIYDANAQKAKFYVPIYGGWEIRIKEKGQYSITVSFMTKDKNFTIKLPIYLYPKGNNNGMECTFTNFEDVYIFLSTLNFIDHNISSNIKSYSRKIKIQKLDL